VALAVVDACWLEAWNLFFSCCLLKRMEYCGLLNYYEE
jgi:hypothetical protein